MSINKSLIKPNPPSDLQVIQPYQSQQTDPKASLPQKYFDLIQRIGSSGIYQRNLFLIFSAQWFVAAFFALGTSFLYLSQNFNCYNQGLLVQDCYDTVCKLPQSQWERFLANKQIESLATQFGPFYCSNQSLLNSLKTVNYIGTFFGYLIFAYLSDNYGRKFSLICSWTTSCVGITILAFSPNIWVASVGLFMAGGGTKGSVRINSAIFTETVENQMRQKYVIIAQVFQGLAGISVAVFYLLIPDWRIVTGVLIGIPCLIVLFFVVYYLQQTPKFLLQKDQQKALKSLNKIAKINKIPILLTATELNSVIKHQSQSIKGTQSKYTPLDLFKFKSLRLITVCAWIIYFCISFLYIGPTLIIDSFGFNPYLSQIVVASSELIGNIIIVFLIQTLPRQKAGIFFFSLSSIFTGILIFVQKPSNCENCVQGVIQLIFVFGSRFCTTCFFSTFILYVLELYPQSVRALGISSASAFGAISAIAGPVVIGFFAIHKLNNMLLFTFAGLIGIGAVLFLPETLNTPLKDDIYELVNKESVVSDKLLKANLDNDKIADHV